MYSGNGSSQLKECRLWWEGFFPLLLQLYRISCEIVSQGWEYSTSPLIFGPYNIMDIGKFVMGVILCWQFEGKLSESWQFTDNSSSLHILATLAKRRFLLLWFLRSNASCNMCCMPSGNTTTVFLPSDYSRTPISEKCCNSMSFKRVLLEVMFSPRSFKHCLYGVQIALKDMIPSLF